MKQYTTEKQLVTSNFCHSAIFQKSVRHVQQKQAVLYLVKNVSHYLPDNGILLLKMARRMAAPSSARYHKLSKADDGFIDLQFEAPPPKIPYRAIALAVVLFIFGSLLIIIGALLLAEIIDTKYSDRTWPVLILGLLMFIPGAYHVRIAYYAYRGYKGYSYDDIPEYDD
ncbi:hypothetical protein LSH36_91g02014 [Paralvinella palmiformis]|uniref:Transmembrane protein 230 n=1 Tax=Paralvinella palmiformis TaxID=53620 RepID=A0AAD9K294_9ANNE|nr:hypothetical protein LSH36_91g02014 [Paralvinella palmiformis]